MSNSMFGGIPDDSMLRGNSLEAVIAAFREMVDRVAMLQKAIEFKLNGNLDSSDAREFGGFLIGPDTIKSLNGMVGLSSKETAFDDVRFWAGAAIPDLAPFQITKSGKAYLTGALISSAAGWPKVIMDPASALFGAYTSPTEYVEVRSQNYASGYTTPLIEFGYAGNPAYMYFNASGFGISAASNFNLNANGNLVQISHARVPSWGNISTPTETLASKFTAYDNAISSINTALGNKASLFHSHSGSITVTGNATYPFTVF